MEKLSKYKWMLVSIFLGLSVLGGFSIGIPLILGNLIGHTSGSIYVTQYIFIALASFYLFFLPYVFRVSVYCADYSMSLVNTINAVVTILLFVTSLFPLVFLSVFILPVFYITLKIRKRPPYVILFLVGLTTLFFLGVFVVFYGKRDKNGKLIPADHKSPLDYILAILATLGHPWNVIAGKNLRENRKTTEDKVVSSLLGRLIDRYAITIDREDKDSRGASLLKTASTLKKGMSVVWFPEGGRTTATTIREGILLRDFHDKVFKHAWKQNISVQPIAFDLSAWWRGKNDCWGVRTGVVRIHYCEVVDPSKYASVETFKEACHRPIKLILEKSEMIKIFQKI